MITSLKHCLKVNPVLSTVSENRLVRIIKGSALPIRKSNTTETDKIISAFLMKTVIHYIGISVQKSDHNVFNEATKFLKNHYGGIGVEEIETAFSMAVAGEFADVDCKTYGGIFSIRILGDIMKNYLPYRNRLLQEIEKEKTKLAEVEKQKEIEKKNEQARQQICDEFFKAVKMQIAGNPMWLTWHDVPHHYAKVLIDRGLLTMEIEEKKRIWSESQKLALDEIKSQAHDDAQNIFERKRLFDLIEKAQAGESVLDDSAKRIYSKLILFEYLKKL